MTEVDDEGPFFHGTTAELQPGDLLTAGFRSNYRPEIVMNHIYFTSLPSGAGLAAELAGELVAGGEPHVYRVEPTGAWENDPNVTDKKFPGNPTRSYRSANPLRIVEEVHDWPRLAPEELEAWRGRLTALREARAEASTDHVARHPVYAGCRDVNPLGRLRSAGEDGTRRKEPSWPRSCPRVIA